MKEKYRHPQPGTQGLIGHWKLWAGPTGDTTVFDYSLNGNTGTLTGTNLMPQYPGYSFAGSDELIDCGNMDAAMAVSKLTVSIWAKPDAIGGTRVLMGNTETGNAMFEYHIDNDGKINVNAYTSSWSQHINTTAIKAAVFTHIVITYDGTDFRWYLDGSLDDTDAHGAGGAIARENAQQDMTIGAISSDSNNFAGVLDDARIYNRVLSAADAKSLYELTKWRYQ